MIWTVIHWTISFLFWVAMAVVIVTMSSNRRSAVDRADGTVEFAPSWLGVLALVFVAIRVCFISWHYMRLGAEDLTTFVTGVFLALGSIGLVFMLPGTILVTNSGVELVTWLWPHKRIPWDKIVEINTERKGSAVTVIGADKTKIIHSGRLPDRARFLTEIRHYCAENLPADFPSQPYS